MDKLQPMPSTEQEPCFELFPYFKIRPFDGWHIWLENYSGEGMAVRKAIFVNILQKFWDKEY